MGVASIGRAEFRQALGKDAPPAGPSAAEECPYGQLETDGPRPPGKVCQAALIAAMPRGGWHGTVWTSCRWRGRRELEPHRLILHVPLHEAEPTGGWEQLSDQCLPCKGHHLRIIPR